MSIASALARTRTGWLAHLGLALSLLAMLGTSMHVLLVKHELCDDHGALVEADAAHASTQDDPEQDGADGAAEDTHDTDVHCPLGVASHAPLAVPPAVALELHVVDAPRVHALSLVPVFVTRDLWRVAPKTSPPAA